MILGRIVYNDELVNHKMVDYIEYVKDNVNYNSFINQNIPTLYVGWNFLKNNNGDSDLISNAYIDDKTILLNKLYWEFSFNESKGEHVDGVETFVNNVPYYYFNNNYKFINVDPIFLNIKNIDELFVYLPKQNNACYVFNNSLYILSNNCIYCVNLNVYMFYGFDINLIKTYIISVTNKCFDDTNGDILVKYKKIFSEFNELKRYIVVILSDFNVI